MRALKFNYYLNLICIYLRRNCSTHIGYYYYNNLSKYIADNIYLTQRDVLLFNGNYWW